MEVEHIPRRWSASSRLLASIIMSSVLGVVRGSVLLLMMWCRYGNDTRVMILTPRVRVALVLFHHVIVIRVEKEVVGFVLLLLFVVIARARLEKQFIFVAVTSDTSNARFRPDVDASTVCQC